MTTLFGLLFWDIIFANIPGAFETAYQVAPLDIAEDTFYTSREELFRARLQELEQPGRAAEIIESAYDHYGPTETATATVCVGVRWDLFTKQDLLELVSVSGILLVLLFR